MKVSRWSISRRSFLAASGGGVAFAAMMTTWPVSANSPAEYRLVARPGRAPLVGAPYPETMVWSYNGTVPGAEIRVRQGERLQVAVENGLGEETTVHWHGIHSPHWVQW